MLRSQLSQSEERRTEAYAKLNGIFHGDEAQWLVREVLLNDELQDLEEEVTAHLLTQGRCVPLGLPPARLASIRG